MKNLFHLLPICFMVANAMAMQAAAAEVQLGRYVRPHGEGTLVFKRNKQDKLVFDIESSGSNGSSCTITGFLHNGKAHVDPWNAEKTEPKCNVRFSATPVSVTVNADGEECATYCGVHADFIGTYVVPPAACTDASQQKQRERALGSYRMHR